MIFEDGTLVSSSSSSFFVFFNKLRGENSQNQYKFDLNQTPSFTNEETEIPKRGVIWGGFDNLQRFFLGRG